ncbi:MAG: hypothetical protein FWE16_00765 [Firmicutes bacterium]|nr:hypothetical protein [Bacillota bacterium]
MKLTKIGSFGCYKKPTYEHSVGGEKYTTEITEFGNVFTSLLSHFMGDDADYFTHVKDQEGKGIHREFYFTKIGAKHGAKKAIEKHAWEKVLKEGILPKEKVE